MPMAIMDMKLSRWKRCYSAPTNILNTSRQTQIHKVVKKGFENSLFIFFGIKTKFASKSK
jgi:hypothetical protein